MLWPGDKDNTRATRYIDRVTNKANLEASNELFIHLVEEAHKAGIAAAEARLKKHTAVYADFSKGLAPGQQA